MKINLNLIRSIQLQLWDGVKFSETGFVRNLFDLKVYNLIDSKGEKIFEKFDENRVESDSFEIRSIRFENL